jgi:antitoxin ParD1/3/4
MNISVSLTPELVGLIREKVATGRYASTSEVVREALRLLERADQREAEATARLRQAWDEGIASGDAGPVDFEAIKAEGRRRLKEGSSGQS